MIIARFAFAACVCTLCLLIASPAPAQPTEDQDTHNTAPAPDAVQTETLDAPADAPQAPDVAPVIVTTPEEAVPAPAADPVPAPAPVAQDTPEAAPVIEAPSDTPVEAPVEAAMDSAPVIVNYGALESAGTLSNVRDGALGKSLWQNHKRSDVYRMLERIPLRTAMPSVTALKRGALLTQSDATTIQNDIPPAPGYDLLTTRLYTLIDSGLYRDAYDLYTQSVEDPYDEALARVGILLILYNGDMPTACLEEKVLASRYKGVEFWEMMDAACNLEMGGATTSSALDNSAVIKAIFAQPTYKVPAADQGTLLKMSRLERAMLVAQERLDYTALQKDLTLGLQAEPAILMMYLNDRSLPQALLIPLQKEAIARGLLPPDTLKKSDPEYKRISTLETEAEKAAELEKLLQNEPNLHALLPYADMIRENSVIQLPPPLLRKALSVLILAGGEIPALYTDALLAEAAEKPQNYVYLQVLTSLGRADKSVNIDVDNLVKGVNALPLATSGQLLAIIDILDKSKKLNDNPARVYEKRLGLTSGGYYVMPSGGLTEWLETAQSEKLTGLTVLIALSMLPDQPGTVYAGTLTEAINALRAVGLIESANKIIEEIFVSTLKDNKGE